MKNLFALLMLVTVNSFAADNIIVPKNSGKMFLKDSNGLLFPAKISYTTDGSGHLHLINSNDPVDDDITVANGNAYLNGTDGKLYPAEVHYTTDGNGNVIPIPSASSSGAAWGDITGTLSDQTDLQSALGLKLNLSDYGKCASSGVENTCVGVGAGSSGTTGDYNTIFGSNAGFNGTTARVNTLVGQKAGFSNITGEQNTYIGEYAGYGSLGNYNVAVGVGAGYQDLGSYNTNLGQFAGFVNSSGTYNTNVGNSAGYNNTTGLYNTNVGAFSAYRNTTGYGNAFFGEQSAEYNTDGYYGTAIGYGALGSNTVGFRNTALGESAGYSNIDGNRNTFIGTEAGYPTIDTNASVHSSDLVYIGDAAGSSNTSTLTNSIVIGSGATMGASNAWEIGKLGTKQYIREGSNAAMGAVTLVGGTATVSNTLVTANSRIFLTAQNSSGTAGAVRVSSRVAGTSFTITSTSGTDTSLIAYEIKEPN